MSAWGPARLALLLALSALAGGGPADAGDLRELVAAYRGALASGALGEVAAEFSGEPTRVGTAPTPYEGVAMILLPYSARVEADLDAVKARARDSLRAYGQSATGVAAVRETYEQQLHAADGEELIRWGVSDSQGRIRLAQVPAGDWLLLAWRDDPHAQGARRVRPQDAARFSDLRVPAGYTAVTYWRSRVEVLRGATADISLTDRNVWFNAVREDTTPPRVKPRTGGRR